MARCTAPINGHRTASGRANCPVCGRGGISRYLLIFIPHILHHILREQIIPKAVVVVVYKLRRRHVGLHLVLLFCIRPQKFERLRLFVKML